MRTLRRYLLREVILLLGASLLLFSLLPLSTRAVELSELLMGGMGEALELLPLLLPSILVFSLPLSLLLAVLLAVGRMAQEGEFTALRSSGVGPHRLLPSILLISLGCAGVSLGVSAYVTPWTTSRMAELGSRMALQVMRAIRPGFNQHIPHMVLYVERVEGDRLKGVFLYDLRGDPPLLVTAREATAASSGDEIVLILEEGEAHRVEGDAYWRTTFQRYQFRLQPKKPRYLKGEWGLWDLWRRGKSLKFHQRLCLCLSPLVLGVLGLELGLLARRSYRSHGLICCFGVTTVFYLALSGGQALVEAALSPAWLGGWMPSLLLGTMALVLFPRIR